MMPSGLIIWPGALRGVESNGMVVSGRELQLTNAPQVPGALILPDDFQEVGEAFDFEKAQGLFA
jgi:tRNA-binding protein